MGSFNVSCGISNLSIHEGDRIGFMLIGAAPVYSNAFRPAATYSCRIYNTDDYLPYLPPVFGLYDDYGRISALEESVTTEVIEKLFGRPALEVVNAVGNDRDVYDYCNEISVLYMEPKVKEILEKFGATDEDVFRTLGFEPTSAEPEYLEAWSYEGWRLQKKLGNTAGFSANIVRYSWALDHPATGQRIFRDALALNGLDIVFSAFGSATGLYPGFPQEHWTAMLLLSTLSGTFFLREIYEGMRPLVLEDEWFQEGMAEMDKAITQAFAFTGEFHTKPEESQLLLTSAPVFSKIAMKTHEELRELKRYIGKDEYAELRIYPAVLQSANRMLQPTFNGYQFGNDKEARELNKLTDNVLKDRKKRFSAAED